jgi:DNA-binding MarR family transcriptional regulator
MKPPLSRPKARQALLEELEHSMRRASALGTIFSQTVAQQAGLSSSDHECLDFLNLENNVTAGRLAEVTGLTTGAITGVVDRLEKAGYVRRVRDASDRRKVFIEIVPESVARVGRYYEYLQRSMLELWSTYSDAELKLVLQFTNDGYETMLGAVEHLKTMVTPSDKEAASASRKGRGKGRGGKAND